MPRCVVRKMPCGKRWCHCAPILSQVRKNKLFARSVRCVQDGRAPMQGMVEDAQAPPEGGRRCCEVHPEGAAEPPPPAAWHSCAAPPPCLGANTAILPSVAAQRLKFLPSTEEHALCSAVMLTMLLLSFSTVDVDAYTLHETTSWAPESTSLSHDSRIRTIKPVYAVC